MIAMGDSLLKLPTKMIFRMSADKRFIVMAVTFILACEQLRRLTSSWTWCHVADRLMVRAKGMLGLG